MTSSFLRKEKVHKIILKKVKNIKIKIVKFLFFLRIYTPHNFTFYFNFISTLLDIKYSIKLAKNYIYNHIFYQTLNKELIVRL